VHRKHHLHVWDRIHRWSSLACTLFLLLLCLTGLPLIFGEEIGHLSGRPVAAPQSGYAPIAGDVDRVIDAAAARHPALAPQYASQAAGDHGIWYVTMGAPQRASVQVAVDARSAAVLGEPQLNENGVMGVVRSLHVDLFAGLPGRLLLGFMGLLFVIAVVSGIALYAPFLHRRPFGSIRRDAATRIAWLDVHNLLGVTTLLWALVVGATGVINSCSELLLGQWRAQELARLVPQADAAPRATSMRLQSMVEAAVRIAPGREIAFIAFPGTAFTDAVHHAVYLRGLTPITARLSKPVFADLRSGEVLPLANMPWYLTLLFLSEPLHFGDYGGLPLKILWALLDVISIVVLGSGAYLFFARRMNARRRAASMPPLRPLAP
jgi:uncharacterized iron-regulated membrane protein